MSALQLPRREPPHDPYSLLLSSHLGFRAATATTVEVDPDTCALGLPLLATSARRFDEASGSLGGVRPPTNVALGPAGEIYLLHTDELALLRFDACTCRFVRVRCFGGRGSGARQLRGARAIAIACGKLFVCDTENQRISVLSLNGFALVGHLAPPPVQLPWSPTSLAVDTRGRVWVGDATGRLHRFRASGSWDTAWPMAAPRFVAVDCRDRVYVVSDGAPGELRMFSAEHEPIVSLPHRPRDVGHDFAALPFDVDASGVLWIDGCGAFGASGEPLELTRAIKAERYQRSGIFRSQPLDSKIAQCVWHRVVLHGALPPGTRVKVRALTADEDLTNPAASGADLGLLTWYPAANAEVMDPGDQWDCLLRTPPGRYLWLELAFEGDGVETPAIRAIEVEFPRISLRRYLPAVFGAEPTSADFTDRFLALFDTSLRGIERQVDEMARLFDPGSAPAAAADPRQQDFLSWLGSWLGVALDRNWDEATRRRFLRRAGALFARRGTLRGLREELLLLLDFAGRAACPPEVRARASCAPLLRNCGPEPAADAALLPPLILEHFRLRRWLRVGRGRLGDDAVIWAERIVGRTRLGAHGQAGVTRLDRSPDPEHDPFLVHAHQFSVFVPASYKSDERKRRSLENWVKREAPAGTRGYLHFVEPRFRIGTQAMLGFDSVIGAVPQGVTLRETPLGGASILTAPPHRRGGPAIALDREGRVGSTTRL